MTKSELKQLKYLHAEKLILQVQIDKLRSLATSTTVAPAHVPSNSGEHDKVGQCIAEILDLLKELVLLETGIVIYINKISDPLTREIFTLHYVEGHSLKKIAEKLNYSYDHIRRVHAQQFKDATTCHNMPQ